MNKVGHDVIAFARAFVNAPVAENIGIAEKVYEDLKDAVEKYEAADNLRILPVDSYTPEAATTSLMEEVAFEVERARLLHPGCPTHHHMHSVIQEELDEYWEQVKAFPKRHDPAKMRTELIHIAATALRAILEVPAEQWARR